MSHLRPWHGLSLALAVAFGVVSEISVRSEPGGEQRLDGCNVIVAVDHPFGSETTKISLANAKGVGARAVAIIPFFWQATPASPRLLRGADMTDAQLHSAIHDAHALGLAVVVKPHVWVPESWAGTVAMQSEDAWKEWFANYRRELERVARIAADERAEALSIGTELEKTTQRPEWNDLITAARAAYSGRLMYMAHNVEEAETVPFWDRLDAIGVTLYPSLGADDDPAGWRAVMRGTADRLDMLWALTGKTIVVGEIGLRSAVAATAKPWESAEERDSPPDPALQAAVIAEWLAALDRPAISGVLIWRWFTDPDAGGMTDTDFTVQGKPAEQVLTCAWTKQCEEPHATAQSR
jgi:hypothetical protein